MVKGAIANNSPQYPLRGVLMHVGTPGIEMIGSNADISIKGIVAGDDYEADSEDTILLNADYLEKIISKVDGDIVELSTKGNIAEIKCGGSKYKLNMLNADDYPRIGFDSTGETIEFSNLDFAEIIDKTVFAVSTKETRPVLTGVNFSISNGQLSVTATDSYRLSKYVTTVDNQNVTQSCTIPASSLKVVRKAINNDGTVKINVDSKAITFETATGYTLKTTLLSGGYPETDRLIPKSGFCTTVTCSRTELISVIERGSIFKNDGYPVFNLRMNDDGLLLGTKNSEFGEYSEEVAASIEGDKINVCFSGAYIIDALKALDTDEVVIKFVGEMKPFIAENVGSDKDIVELMLPIRTYN